MGFFLLDESVDHRLASHLRTLGHDVTSVALDHRQALADREVLAIALNERRVLITNDHDFGELIFRLGLPHSGVILFRLRSEALEAKKSSLERVLSAHAQHLNDFIVVSDSGVRVRAAPRDDAP